MVVSRMLETRRQTKADKVFTSRVAKMTVTPARQNWEHTHSLVSCEPPTGEKEVSITD